MHPRLGMLPVLHLRFDDLHVALSTHAALVVLGVLAGMALAVRRARAPLVVLAVAPAIAAAALGGAWLLFRALHGPPGGGLASMGGLAAGALAAAVAARAAGRPLVHLLDDLAPGGVLALGVGRIGCFLAGCCAGRETTLPWGVVLPVLGTAARHPLQLYAAAFDVVLAAVVARTTGPPGTVARRALVGLGLGRLALETLRDPVATDPILGGWSTVAQLGALTLVVAGLAIAPRSRPSALAVAVAVTAGGRALTARRRAGIGARPAWPGSSAGRARD